MNQHYCNKQLYSRNLIQFSQNMHHVMQSGVKITLRQTLADAHSAHIVSSSIAKAILLASKAAC